MSTPLSPEPIFFHNRRKATGIVFREVLHSTTTTTTTKNATIIYYTKTSKQSNQIKFSSEEANNLQNLQNIQNKAQNNKSITSSISDSASTVQYSTVYIYVRTLRLVSVTSEKYTESDTLMSPESR